MNKKKKQKPKKRKINPPKQIGQIMSEEFPELVYPPRIRCRIIIQSKDGLPLELVDDLFNVMRTLRIKGEGDKKP